MVLIHNKKVKTLIISLVAISLFLIYNLNSLFGKNMSSHKGVALLLTTVGLTMIGFIYLLEVRRTRLENEE